MQELIFLAVVDRGSVQVQHVEDVVLQKQQMDERVVQLVGHTAHDGTCYSIQEVVVRRGDTGRQ